MIYQVTATAGVNLRETPQTGRVLHVLPYHYKLDTVLAETPEYIEVQTEFGKGYVVRNFVDQVADYSDLLDALASQYGIDVKIAKAIISVEAGGTGVSQGRPVIRLEAHILLDIFGDPVRMHFSWDKTKPWVNQLFRGQPYHGNQESEYETLRFANQTWGPRSYEACSMGIGQLMGFHAQTLGYGSAKEMHSAFFSEEEQYRSFFIFLRRQNMIPLLQKKDFLQFATLYNGPGQAARYADLIQSHL